MKCSVPLCDATAAQEVPFCRRCWNSVPRALQRKIIMRQSLRALTAARAAVTVKHRLLPTKAGYAALLACGYDKNRIARGIIEIRY